MTNGLAERILEVKDKIAVAALKSGRKPEQVKLIGVSKTKSISLLQEAFSYGQTIFGENYLQEALPKLDALPMAEWHFIGSLQTNKVKLVIGRFAMIHSVDRLRLISELDKVATERGLVQEILLEVNIGDEWSKGGVSVANAPEMIESILSRPSLRLRGIMALPPLTESEDHARSYFSKLRELHQSLRAQYFLAEKEDCFTELSMGTSSDFESAILEGATCVRVGTAIFGER
jgi:pyridoxal phosphate enzyme (YggS family)